MIATAGQSATGSRCGATTYHVTTAAASDDERRDAEASAQYGGV